MKRIYTCSILAILAATQGCMNQTDRPQTARTLSLDSVPSLPRVDASTLLISDIQIVQFQNPKFNGAVQPLVDFSYSGSAEYVEVATCVNSETTCGEPKDIFKTQWTLTNGPSGAKIYVKMRACVDPARATGPSNCGEWFQTSYTQWAVSNREMAALQEEEESIELARELLARRLTLLRKLKYERALKCEPATDEQRAALETDRKFAASLDRLGHGALGLVADALAKGSGKCQAIARAEAERVDKDEGDTKSTASLNLNIGSSLASMIGPNGLSSENLKTVVDSLTDSLRDRPAASSNPAVAECIAEATASRRGRITLNDVGEILPDLSGAIFDFATAKRSAALEGICNNENDNRLEASIEAASEATKILAAELQARTARLNAKRNRGNP